VTLPPAARIDCDYCRATARHWPAAAAARRGGCGAAAALSFCCHCSPCVPRLFYGPTLPGPRPSTRINEKQHLRELLPEFFPFGAAKHNRAIGENFDRYAGLKLMLIRLAILRVNVSQFQRAPRENRAPARIAEHN
jgi:hypothetical protein